MLFLSHKKAISTKERGGFILLLCFSRCEFFERKNIKKKKKHRLLALAHFSNILHYWELQAAVYNIQMEEYGHGEGSGGG